MANLKKVPTADLLAYMNVLDNLIQSETGILNQCSQFIQTKKCAQEELQHIIDDTIISRKEALELSTDVQREIDLRMRNDIGLERGIRKAQSILAKFEHTINQLAKKEAENMEREYSKLKVEEDDNPEQR